MLPTVTTYASNAELRQLEALRNGSGSRFHPLQWGFDRGVFESVARERSEEHIRLLHVGRPAPHKGRGRALEVVQALRGLGHRAMVTFVGSCAELPLEESLRGPQARYVGHVSSSMLAREMSRSDIMLATADRESFGLAVLEALAAGLPVVSTPTGFAADALPSGAGVVTPAFHPTELAASVVRVFQGYREAYERAARATATPFAGWHRSASQAVAIYASLTQSRRRWNASAAA
jgi:glycosyltransferase involved in cell wall biosynthesis